MKDRAGRRLKPVWRALADPTRRKILDLLRGRPRTTGGLASELPVSRFAVMKHLSVLVAARLVIVRRRGRERWNHLNAVPLREMYERWVRPYQAHWASGLAGLAEHVEEAESMAKSKGTKDEKDAGAKASKSRVNAGGWAVAEHETSIRAPADRVWRALTEDMGRWWRQDFHALAKSRMRLEPVLGGRMYEHADDGSGLVWFTVIGIQPARSLDLVGHLTAAFGGPATVLLRFDVTETGGGTIVRVSESRTGAVSDESTASAAQGWALLMDHGLKPWVERGD